MTRRKAGGEKERESGDETLRESEELAARDRADEIDMARRAPDKDAWVQSAPTRFIGAFGLGFYAARVRGKRDRGTPTGGK